MISQKSNDKTPIIQATIDEYNVAFFYCPYCKHRHSHGLVSGYRVSHCTNKESPLFGKQYYFLLPGDEVPK